MHHSLKKKIEISWRSLTSNQNFKTLALREDYNSGLSVLSQMNKCIQICHVHNAHTSVRGSGQSVSHLTSCHQDFSETTAEKKNKTCGLFSDSNKTLKKTRFVKVFKGQEPSTPTQARFGLAPSVTASNLALQSQNVVHCTSHKTHIQVTTEKPRPACHMVSLLHEFKLISELGSRLLLLSQCWNVTQDTENETSDKTQTHSPAKQREHLYGKKLPANSISSKFLDASFPHFRTMQSPSSGSMSEFFET